MFIAPLSVRIFLCKNIGFRSVFKTARNQILNKRLAVLKGIWICYWWMLSCHESVYGVEIFVRPLEWLT